MKNNFTVFSEVYHPQTVNRQVNCEKIVTVWSLLYLADIISCEIKSDMVESVLKVWHSSEQDGGLITVPWYFRLLIHCKRMRDFLYRSSKGNTIFCFYFSPKMSFGQSAPSRSLNTYTVGETVLAGLFLPSSFKF